MALEFSRAEAADAEALAQLVNSAYRGDASRLGWTTEADLLDGRRIDAAGILDLLAESDSLILACKRQNRLLGSVHLRHAAGQVHIGMLAVSPAHQARVSANNFCSRPSNGRHEPGRSGFLSWP
ncbi:GNAT family N-acetyltransferase [Methylomonas koyamae]|uniref:GNAT family N-acetyltransferase n=1 Tax=Methylomonas koyamae TaxID=702114 RepID=UPI000AC8B2D6|nr:GNAT family N-acetyltransferase [Methylomonas koyamae]